MNAITEMKSIGRLKIAINPHIQKIVWAIVEITGRNIVNKNSITARTTESQIGIGIIISGKIVAKAVIQ